MQRAAPERGPVSFQKEAAGAALCLGLIERPGATHTPLAPQGGSRWQPFAREAGERCTPADCAGKIVPPYQGVLVV